MKLIPTFSALAIAIAPLVSSGQTVPGGKANAKFTGLDKAGASVVIKSKAGSMDLGVMSLTGNGRGGTDISFDLTALSPKKQTLKLYSGTTLIREMPYRGPSAPDLEMISSFLPIEGATLVSEDEDWLWVLAGAIILWCVETEHTVTTTYDANGNVTGSVETESLNWDCDMGMVVNTGGGQYGNVTRVEVVAETDKKLPPVSATSFSAIGGARITTVR